MENERENLFDTPQEAAEDAVQDAYTQEVSAPAEEDVAAQSACAPEEAAAVCEERATPVEHTAAQSSDEQKPKKKKQKRCIGLTAAVCLMVVCSILGGIIGGIVYGLVRDAQNKPHSSPVYDGSRPPTIIDPREVDTSKLMTPAEVYAANVNATVGISTSIVSTNFWGYQSLPLPRAQALSIAKMAILLPIITSFKVPAPFRCPSMTVQACPQPLWVWMRTTTLPF